MLQRETLSDIDQVKTTGLQREGGALVRKRRPWRVLVWNLANGPVPPPGNYRLHPPLGIARCWPTLNVNCSYRFNKIVGGDR
jgi:hypothetical protein